MGTIERELGTGDAQERKDEAAHGEYRTRRVILEIYDAMQQAMEAGQPYQTLLDPHFVFEKRVAFEVIVSGQLWLCDDLGHNHLRLKLGKGFRYYTEPNLPCQLVADEKLTKGIGGKSGGNMEQEWQIEIY